MSGAGPGGGGERGSLGLDSRIFISRLCHSVRLASQQRSGMPTFITVTFQLYKIRTSFVLKVSTFQFPVHAIYESQKTMQLQDKFCSRKAMP